VRPPSGTPPNPFVAHIAEKMRSAEPASAFAERVLQALAEDAPFYWLTHPETRSWIEGPTQDHRARPPAVQRLRAPA